MLDVCPYQYVCFLIGEHNDVRQLKQSQTSKLCLFSKATARPGLRRSGYSLSQTGQISVCYLHLFQDFGNLLMDTSTHQCSVIVGASFHVVLSTG